MIIELLKEIGRGRSLARSLMNLELRRRRLSGKILDLGGAKQSEYSHMFERSADCELTNLDLRADDEKMRLDFETDKLPFADLTFDQILFLNLLEHLYNYNLLVSEAWRVLKANGSVIGFVPFLVNYHPNPHDYFRYTGEALKKIFAEAGFSKVEIREIGRGPFAVNFNNLVLSVPRPMRLMMFPVYYFLDYIFLKLRPNIAKRFPLGYVFFLEK